MSAPTRPRTFDVDIVVNAPADFDAVDALNYRNIIEHRTAELGWPQPDSAGTCFAHESMTVELGWWDLAGDIAPVISQLRDEFDVRDVHVDGSAA